MAEASEVVEQQPESNEPWYERPPETPAEGPSFEQFSKDRAAGKVDATAGGDEFGPAGNQWDGKKWVNKSPRDSEGRFSKVRESLERSQKRSTYVKGVLEGAVEPDEATMDADTWAAARNAQIARGTNKITPPEFPEEKPADAGAKNAEGSELSPEEVQHIEKHSDLMSSLAAKKLTDSTVRNALENLGKANLPPAVGDYLGHVLADVDNPQDVLIALGNAPDVVRSYANLPAESMRAIVQHLSVELAGQKERSKAAVSPQKPKPPNPVGARASSGAFDVNDESTDPDEWARQRNEALAKKGRNRW
jgi:hypothetical protein